jgi:hypothetical protein
VICEVFLHSKKAMKARKCRSSMTWRQWRALHSLLFTIFTGSLLAFGHPHEVFSRFDIELLSGLVADAISLFATLAADALFRCTSNDLFYPGQIRWQFLPARMFARLLER